VRWRGASDTHLFIFFVRRGFYNHEGRRALFTASFDVGAVTGAVAHAHLTSVNSIRHHVLHGRWIASMLKLHGDKIIEKQSQTIAHGYLEGQKRRAKGHRREHPRWDVNLNIQPHQRPRPCPAITSASTSQPARRGSHSPHESPKHKLPILYFLLLFPTQRGSLSNADSWSRRTY
jgi:hypothetical protein